MNKHTNQKHRKHVKQAERRGRKMGDGILKEIIPQSAALGNLLKLAYGRYANDPIAEMVLEWWAICEQAEDLAILEDALGKDRIKAAQSEAEASGRSSDHDAFKYLLDKGMLDRRYEDKRLDFELAARLNLTNRNAEWFRRVADVIEKVSTEADCYPLHAALMRLGELDHTVNKQGLRCYSAGAPLSAKLHYTIDGAARKLARLKPTNQSDKDWKTTVRRACDDLGLRLLSSKRGGPKLKPL
jgi:hypothetical protein